MFSNNFFVCIETRIDFAVTLVHYLEATSENEIALE